MEAIWGIAATALFIYVLWKKHTTRNKTIELSELDPMEIIDETDGIIIHPFKTKIYYNHKNK